MPFGVSQSFSFCGAEGSTRVWGFWCLFGTMEEGVWAEWDEGFSGSSPEGQHSGRDGLTAPTDIVPKAVCMAPKSTLVSMQISTILTIDQPFQMKLLLLNTSSTRRSEERRELRKDCAILNADQAPLVQVLASAIPPIQRCCMVLQVRSSRELLL